MTRFWNRWIGCRKSIASREARRRSLRRRLRSEPLETRQLLAADFFHNGFNPEDVNNDGNVTAGDALAIINAMNRQSRADGEMFTDVNNDGQRTAADALRVINRLNRESPRRGQDRRDGPGQAPPEVDPPGQDNDGPNGTPTDDPTGDLSEEVRTIDGSGNNLENPELGAADTPLLRVGEADYADGISEPAGQDRPSAREISNLLSAADPDGTTSERNLTSFVNIWGQFLDHDIDLSLEGEGDLAESFDIQVPAGDPLFDPTNSGDATIHLTRSAIDPDSGTSTENPAEQVNVITAWIDGSQVYGSDQETADALREFVGGRLLIGEDGLLPSDGEGGVLAGDIRAAENIALTSMHTLFVREHNRLADEIAASDASLTDEQIYQEARAMVIAQLQAITYNEFLPALLGEGAISDYEGYDANVDPSIANEFSTAAFRFGHSTLNDTIPFIGNDGTAVQDSLSLAQAFFNPSILEGTGIDSVLKGGASNLSQEIDLEVVDSLRNFLFGAPGQGGLDLVSLNIQRGRDHGLSDLNATRVAYGLEAHESFADITSDLELQANLESLYGDVNNIDLWVGVLAEDHVDGASLGETASVIIADQFERLRDGDRFWYENTLGRRELREVQNTTLADVIERNTNVDSLQSNVFFFAPQVSGRVTQAPAPPTDGPAPDAPNPDDPNPADAAETVVLAEGERARPDDGLGQQPPGENQLAADANRRDNGGRRRDGQPNDRGPRPDRPGPEVEGIAGVTVELLDQDGNVMETTTTDENGRYRFNDFDATGSYQIRLVSDDTTDVVGPDTLEVQISNGSERLSGHDFQMLT